MNPKNVLIVDDSFFFRSFLLKLFNELNGYRVAGFASHGEAALLKMEQGQQIDLIILDYEMPVLDGLSFLKRFKKLNEKAHVLMFSSHTVEGAEVTIKALREGAVDFITKPKIDLSNQASSSEIFEFTKKAFKEKLDSLFPVHDSSAFAPTQNFIINEFSKLSQNQIKQLKPEFIVLASSTGGPKLLEQLFKVISQRPSIPIVIIQHLPAYFTHTLAKQLSLQTGYEFVEAKNNMVAEKGKIYIAPGDFHLLLKKEGHQNIFITEKSAPVNYVRPAADVFLKSASRIFKDKLLAIILTGMGKDAQLGSVLVKENNGAVVCQDPTTATIPSMIESVIKANACDQVLPPMALAQFIESKSV